MNQSTISQPHLRLISSPPPDPRASWSAEAERDGRAFLTRHGHALADPSLAAWVIEECAELAWDDELRAGRWSTLRIDELWMRLANLHRFFPQPRLVIAYYETLRVFLPWLALHGRLERERAARMMERLEQAAAAMLAHAREQIAARNRAALRLARSRD